MLDNPNLDELIKEAQKGEQEAFGKLYDLFAGPIFRYIKIKISDQVQAEDLLQETFLKCWKALGQFQSPGNFKAWVYRIATNTINDYFRKMYRNPQTLELDEQIEIGSSENIALDIANKLETEKVISAFKLLPEKYAQVLELRFVQDLSFEETAKILNKNPVSIRVIQHRALKKLHLILLDDENDLEYSKIQ